MSGTIHALMALKYIDNVSFLHAVQVHRNRKRHI